jgi:DNA polymerase III subunit epsilon
MTPTFVAIDFETADPGADSACAVGLVRVEGWQVVAREARLIRPPRKYIRFSYIHGITWPKVQDAPFFGELWPQVAPVLDGADFLVAHNAPFDRGVLRACCEAAGLAVPALPFVCSMREARQAWGVRPTRLPDVCRYLGLTLNHHDALSDAEAAARIVIAARAGGVLAQACGPAARTSGPTPAS